MRYGRVLHEGSERWALVRDGEALLLDAAPWLSPDAPRDAVALDAARVSWLAPVTPSKVLAMGRTYAEHARERGYEPPSQPVMFFKPPSSLLAHGGDVVLPPESSHVELEGELALVISRRVRRFPKDGDPADVVFGCVPADDVSARDLQKSEGQWARAKGFDTFCPLGPLVTRGLPDPGARLRTHLDGELRQDAPLSLMSFTLADLLAHASSAMTLLPGDLLLTGTPKGVARLVPGSCVRVEIDGLAPLEHGVVVERPDNGV